MYINSDDVRKNNPELYDKIKNIIYKLHGIIDETKFSENGNLIGSSRGWNGLVWFLYKNLTKDEQNTIETNGNLSLYVGKIILEQINKFEASKQAHDQNEFANAVLQEIRIMLADIKKYTQTHTLDDYDSLKFALSGKCVMKYHFYASCGNAASAFAYVNSTLPPTEQIPSDRILFLSSTQWNFLHDGMHGHTIPCIKMDDGNWYAVDPQKQPNKSGIEFITSEIKPGNKIYHILNSNSGTPHMITKLTTAQDYYEIVRYGGFWDELGKVAPDKAKVFLKSIMKEVNPDEMKAYIEKMFKTGYFTEQDKKELLFNLSRININDDIQKHQNIVYTPDRENG